MPTPNKNENHEDYIKRCMGYNEMMEKHPDEKQRYAICESMWKQHSKGETETWIKNVLEKK